MKKKQEVINMKFRADIRELKTATKEIDKLGAAIKRVQALGVNIKLLVNGK